MVNYPDTDTITQEEFIKMIFSHKTITTGRSYRCYFDGAISVNPGGAIGAGVYIEEDRNLVNISSLAKNHQACVYIEEDRKGDAIFSRVYEPPHPDNTCNVGEYIAFMRVLELMTDKRDCKIEIFGDSKLVVNQMTGYWDIKEGFYKCYAEKSSRLLKDIRRNNKVSIRWIRREFNTIADEQSKNAIKEQTR